MSKAIVRFLAILGALWLITMVIMIVAVLGVKGKVSDKTILEANFEQALPEDIPDSPTARLRIGERATVRDVVDAIDRGAADDRVVGMVAKIGAAPLGMAKVQEIREAVQRFRAHRKFAIAYAETFGEFGPGNGAYYLATAFDQIYLQGHSQRKHKGLTRPYEKSGLLRPICSISHDFKLLFFMETYIHAKPNNETMHPIYTCNSPKSI